MQTIKIDISVKSIIPVVNAKQGEIGRKIEIVLTNNREAYQIPANAQITVWYSGASGSGNYKDIGAESAVSVSENKITVEMIAQMLSNAGGGYLCLMMSTGAGNRIGLWNIPYMVEYVPGSGSAEAKENYTVFAPLDKTLTVSGRAADAAAVGEALKKLPAAGDSVKYTPQDLSEAQKAQARENIGASTYYHTERKEIGVSHDDINSEYIWGLYDALMEEYPDNVQKKEVHDKDSTFTNYEYVISTREYPTDALYALEYGADTDIKKPKYLILSGIHGDERCVALSAYRFIRDVLSGHNVPQSFKESAIVRIMPVGSPSAINSFTRDNEDKVNVNRNFDDETKSKETQAIINWLNANADADLFIDCHNNGAIHEVAAILGDSENDVVDMVKKIALQGVDRVIPFWRDVIGYPPVETQYKDANGVAQKGVRDVIFSYSANWDVVGSSIYYASNTLGVPSIMIEASVYYGNLSDWEKDKKVYPPETIAAGAEALGNILIAIYEQSFFGEVVDDMKVIDGKLDTLMMSVNSGFRMESGVLHFDEDQGVGASSYKLKIPCTSAPKAITIRADDATYALIKDGTTASDGNYWFIGAMGNAIAIVGSKSTYRSYVCQMNTLNNKWQPTEAGTTFDNTDCTFVTFGVKAGNYNWSAYYWNE